MLYIGLLFYLNLEIEIVIQIIIPLTVDGCYNKVQKLMVLSKRYSSKCLPLNPSIVFQTELRVKSIGNRSSWELLLSSF